jgi:SAM-dependent methyltransferase
MGLSGKFIFDQSHARRFVEARQNMLRPILRDLRERSTVQSVADVGCGVGYFSGFFRGLGFDVVGFEGRPGNVEEARRRYPDIEFNVVDVEATSIGERGPYDLVLCIGLLYHLENPLRALRNFSAMARNFLLIESYATPDRQTTFYLREESTLEDQSLTSLALYPSESSLIKICYKVGFSAVHRFSHLPEHEDFQGGIRRGPQRTMLLASKFPLDLSGLVLVPEPRDYSDPWQTPIGRLANVLGRLKNGLRKKVAGRGNTIGAKIDAEVGHKSRRS